MFYLENNCNNPYYNLALEEHILRASNKLPLFFIWINSPSVIIGRFQNTIQEINLSYANDNFINVVRRNSGGGAVYHDLGNINYSFIAPLKQNNISDFSFMMEPVVNTLKKFGLAPEISGRNDMLISGRKFSGTAQHVFRNRLLHHGTILFDSDIDVLQMVLNVNQDKFISKGYKSVKSRVTNLKEHLPYNVTIDEFMFALRDATKGNKTVLTTEDHHAIDKLVIEKYKTWEWNWGISPQYTEKRTKRFSWGNIEALLKIINGQITDCFFIGDFFGYNIDEFRNFIKGTPYNILNIENIIFQININEYFVGASRKDIIDLLIDS